MKKALIVTTISGFLPQFEGNDVKILKEYGCEVHYASNFENPVYSCDRETLEREGIRTHQIDVEKSPGRIRANARAVRQIRQVIDEEGINLIHCHNPMGGAAARIAAGMVRRKLYVIYTAHGLHFYRGAPWKNWVLYYPAERFLARFTDQIVTINKEDYERALRLPLRGRGNADQICGVGVDPERFRPRPELRERKREELGIPQNAFHLVTAAELNDNKNQRVVIEAIARLGREDVHYSICGKGPSGELLEDLIRRYGLERRVRLLGYRTDMEEVLQAADAFAFPSKREGLGIAAVEALLCGVPLIAADNRGTREYAVNGKNGIVCRAESAEDFKAAIRLFAEDSYARGQMAGRCRQSAAAFTTEATGSVMRRVYRRALDALEGAGRG